MTVKEFWDSEERLAIHCNTEKKANKLLKKFDELGKEWCEEWHELEDHATSYLDENEWSVFKEETCYDNKGCFCDKKTYKKILKITIIEFDDLEDFKEEK